MFYCVSLGMFADFNGGSQAGSYFMLNISERASPFKKKNKRFILIPLITLNTLP